MAKGLSEQAQGLLKLIPADGSFVGNTSLRRKSGLGERYWDIRRELAEAELITLGRGRGGSVALQLSKAAELPAMESESENVVDEEAKLYQPLKKLLDDEWGREAKEADDFFELRITGSPKGRTRDGGQWTRPDLTLVEVSTFEYQSGSNLEVTTFEVKRFGDGQNIASVYEAAAHSRWAHYAYLVVEVPEEKVEFPERFISEIERFHIGLMSLWREHNEWKFAVEAEPERLSPDPKELDSLLKTFFHDERRLKEYKRAVGK